MRFSRNWIAAYTDLPAGGELHEAMSMLGLVVDDARPNGDDETLDLDFPSNRPDAMNHLGIARELAIRGGQSLRVPETNYPVAETTASADLVTIAVESPECPRFVGRVAIDVAVGPSPRWLCDRIESIGLRPINNVVDITNFVMWELGRPMHAYDLDKLAESQLVVRRATAGEHLVTLDDVDRELTDQDLVIADANRVIGLAGVMGGCDTGVTEATTRVLLECAFFDAVTIRRMARRHGMHTDASHRFERGLSVAGIDEAVDRACALLHETATATISGDGIDIVGEVPALRQIELRAARLAGLLGVDVAREDVVRTLDGLGFGVDITDDGYAVTVPAQRGDIHREVDVIEEVVRFYGYERLPGTLPMLRGRAGGGLQATLQDEMHLRVSATGLGFQEAMTFAFGSHADQDAFAEGGYAELSNPLSEAFAVMRRNLTPGLLAAAARNCSVGEHAIRLYEIGRTYAPTASDAAVDERRRMAILISGHTTAPHWETPARAATFSVLKGSVETLWQRMRWQPLAWTTATIRGLQQGASAEISCAGNTIGFAGKVDAAVAAAAGIDTEVWVAEIDLEDFAGSTPPPVQLRALPRFPAADRDISLLVKDGTAYAGVAVALAGASDIPLVQHRLLDRYEGNDLPTGTSVWTLRLTYRSTERTLTTEEIEAAHNAAVERLLEELDAQRR